MNPIITNIGKILVHPGMHTALGIANLTATSVNLKKTCDVESTISSANSNVSDLKKSIELMNENVNNVSADINSLRLSTKDIPKFMETANGTMTRIDKLFAEAVPPAPSTVPATPPTSNPNNQQSYDAVYNQGFRDALAKAEADKKANDEAAAAKAKEDAMNAEIANLRQQIAQLKQDGAQGQTQAPANDPDEGQLTLQLLSTLKTLSVNSVTQTELLKELGTKIDSQNEGITNAVNMTNQVNSSIAALNNMVNNGDGNSKTKKS